jgi:hypothetical protein
MRAGVAVVATALALLLSGCVDAPMPVPTPSYTPTYITPPPMTLTPLTGETVPAGSVVGPSLAAKIDNHVAARPQVGLEHADLVFEELVEGGLTRYVAVWQSDVPAEIGPIRSIRPMDPDIISPLGGIVAYSGGQDRFVRAMKATEVYNAIHGQADTADLMYRTGSKISPHNVLVRAPELIARHAELLPPPQQFAFAPDVASASAVRDGSPDHRDRAAVRGPLDAVMGIRRRLREISAFTGRGARPRHRGSPALGGQRHRAAGAHRQRRRGAEDGADRRGGGVGLVGRVQHPVHLVEGLPDGADPAGRRGRRRGPAGARQQLDRAGSAERQRRLRLIAGRLALSVGECQNDCWHSRAVSANSLYTSRRDDPYLWQRSSLSTRRPVAASSAA